MATPMVSMKGDVPKMAEMADVSGAMEKGEGKAGEEQDSHAAAGHGGHGVRDCVWPVACVMFTSVCVSRDEHIGCVVVPMCVVCLCMLGR